MTPPDALRKIAARRGIARRGGRRAVWKYRLTEQCARPMDIFELHAQLAADCHPVGDLGLCRVLLLDDRRYPWLILVPRRSEVSEIYQLDAADRASLLDESCRVGEFMMRAFAGDKLNIGALGNLVPQLHVHHVVRHRDDPAWPGPVWGHSPRLPHLADELAERLRCVREGLGIGA